MPTLAQLTSNRAPAILGEEGTPEALHMVYFPLRITDDHLRMYTDLMTLSSTFKRELAAVEADLAAREEAGDLSEEEAITAALDIAMNPSRRLTAALCEILAEWDMTYSEDGPVVPIDEAHVGALSIALRVAMFEAIMSTRQGSMGKANGTHSQTPTNGGVPRKARKTTSRAGASRRN